MELGLVTSTRLLPLARDIFNLYTMVRAMYLFYYIPFLQD
jgi:hypothetical protein